MTQRLLTALQPPYKSLQREDTTFILLSARSKTILLALTETRTREPPWVSSTSLHGLQRCARDTTSGFTVCQALQEDAFAAFNGPALVLIEPWAPLFLAICTLFVPTRIPSTAQNRTFCLFRGSWTRPVPNAFFHRASSQVVCFRK